MPTTTDCVVAGGGAGVRGREGGGGPHRAWPAPTHQSHPHPGGVHCGLGPGRGEGQRESAAQLRPGGLRDGQVRGVVRLSVCSAVCGVFILNVIVSYWLLPPPSVLIIPHHCPHTKCQPSLGTVSGEVLASCQRCSGEGGPHAKFPPPLYPSRPKRAHVNLLWCGVMGGRDPALSVGGVSRKLRPPSLFCWPGGREEI